MWEQAVIKTMLTGLILLTLFTVNFNRSLKTHFTAAPGEQSVLLVYFSTWGCIKLPDSPQHSAVFQAVTVSYVSTKHFAEKGSFREN